MATTIAKYNHATKLIMGDLDLNTSTLKLGLVTSSYVFAATHTLWSQASTYEVSSGDGYTTGGATIANATLTESSGVCTLDADNVTFSALTKTFRGGVVYASGTFGGIVNPVLFYILFNDTPADRVIEAIDFIVQWNSNGILTI